MYVQNRLKKSKSWVQAMYRYYTCFAHDVPLAVDIDMVALDIEMDRHLGMGAISPNRHGLILLALWARYVHNPLAFAKQQTCDHKNMVCDDYGGPDHGYHSGYCSECGWSYHVTLY